MAINSEIAQLNHYRHPSEEQMKHQRREKELFLVAEVPALEQLLKKRYGDRVKLLLYLFSCDFCWALFGLTNLTIYFSLFGMIVKILLGKPLADFLPCKVKSGRSSWNLPKRHRSQCHGLVRTEVTGQILLGELFFVFNECIRVYYCFFPLGVFWVWGLFKDVLGLFCVFCAGFFWQIQGEHAPLNLILKGEIF